MLDLALPEVLVVGAVALIAVGPKDLPKVMYAFGRWARKARLFTQDLGRAFDQLSREAEIAERMNKNQHTGKPPSDDTIS
jgi:sec-independent protein translocase protein TatB